MGPIERSLSKFFPKFRQRRWVAYVVMVIEAIWVVWAAYARPLLDTVGRYDLIKSDWPAIQAGFSTVAHALGNFAASPVTAIAVFILGFGFLFLDNRLAADQTSNTSTEEQQHPTLISSSNVTQAADVQGDTNLPDADFPIKRTYVFAPIIKGEAGSLYLAGTKPSASDAFLLCLTNEDLSVHLVSARITYSRPNSSRDMLRVVENPLWLANQGRVTSFAVHETKYLVVAMGNRVPYPQHLCSLEDHRLTDNASLGIEARVLEPIRTNIEIELTLDGSRKTTINLSADFKTLRLAPKPKHEKAKKS